MGRQYDGELFYRYDAEQVLEFYCISTDSIQEGIASPVC